MLSTKYDAVMVHNGQSLNPPDLLSTEDNTIFSMPGRTYEHDTLSTNDDIFILPNTITSKEERFIPAQDEIFIPLVLLSAEQDTLRSSMYTEDDIFISSSNTAISEEGHFVEPSEDNIFHASSKLSSKDESSEVKTLMSIDDIFILQYTMSHDNHSLFFDEDDIFRLLASDVSTDDINLKCRD